MTLRPLVVLFSVCLLFACSGKKVDKSTYEEELKSREIKKVSEADLFEKALQIGDSIATRSQLALSSKLQVAIKSGGVPEAISFCKLNALPVVDSLEKKYNAQIKRVSFQYRNPSDEPDSLEYSLLEAYQFNINEGIEVKANIQDPHDGYLLFTKPILINNPLCLRCHGEVGKEISPENHQLIVELYPEDKATGYAMNQLRGMWSIRLSKKNLIINDF